MKLDLEELGKEKWNIEHFDGCPLFTEMTGSGFTKKLPGSRLPVYNICLCYYREDIGDWMTIITNQQKIGQTIVQEFMKDQKSVDDLYKKWLENFHLLIGFYQQKVNQDFSQLNNRELIKIKDEIVILCRDRVSMPGFIDAFTFYADKRLDSLLRNFCLKNKINDYIQIYSILSAPIEQSFFSEEEDKLIALSQQLSCYHLKAGVSLRQFLSKNNKELLNKFLLHLTKYSWIKSSYADFQPYKWEEMENEVEEILKTGKRSKKSIILKNKKLKDSIIEKNKFTPEIISIVRLTEIFIKWQDQRKHYSLTYVTLIYKIINEIYRRTGISTNHIAYCQLDELEDLLGDKFDTKKLKERKNGSLFIYNNGKISDVITGPQTDNFYKKISLTDLTQTKEIKGITASIGKTVFGTAKIIMSYKDISKISVGDILVAPMTRPEHLPGMKKAAAIITDDGGITCHAAITSRELGIPCIIGTKIASKVLKDGDLIEVDTSKGIVSRLNSK